MGRTLRAAALGAALLFGAAACGGAEDPGSSAEPADLRASPAEVSAGLKVVGELAADTARAIAAGDLQARATAEEIEPAWVRIETTIRGHDLAAHSAFALALATLGTAVETADAEKASDAAVALRRAADAYLVKFPADGSSPSPSPGPSGLPPSTPAPSAS